MIGSTPPAGSKKEVFKLLFCFVLERFFSCFSIFLCFFCFQFRLSFSLIFVLFRFHLLFSLGFRFHFVFSLGFFLCFSWFFCFCMSAFFSFFFCVSCFVCFFLWRSLFLLPYSNPTRPHCDRNFSHLPHPLCTRLCSLLDQVVDDFYHKYTFRFRFSSTDRQRPCFPT